MGPERSSGRMRYLSGAIGDSDSSNVDGYLIPATDRDLYLDEMLMNDRTFGNRDPARDTGFLAAC